MDFILAKIDILFTVITGYDDAELSAWASVQKKLRQRTGRRISKESVNELKDIQRNTV
ncbi:MAG TPA: hypothetical protein PL048_22755 [Leptospiraceae bacterium]|nr:hypothetical protein [Leptospiraceae bacterium]HMY68064.1 hypothetical protein [Leptospiraceae bacterium]HMZ61611.1 hypothetical protein [Leptospiraceae bacterium]HNF15367.1 hypothetical protein [Leptospiraceae bacterium]HNF27489.1 hypothetical protein [Leptospiraceae bacterium]